MSVCKGCAWAEWRRTARGHLHPDGSGRCRHPILVDGILLPASAAIGYTNYRVKPYMPSGGYIYRHEALPTECLTFKPKDA